MRNIIILLLGLGLPLGLLGQKGFSVGIQTNYGIRTLGEDPPSSTAIVEPAPGYVSSASLFGQWNFTKTLGLRLQADGLYQEAFGRVNAMGIVDPGTIRSGYGFRFGQVAMNLQASVNFPLNAANTVFLEAYTGMGIRGRGNSDGGCDVGLSGSAPFGDSTGVTYVSASRLIHHGFQPELLGGIRLIRQISKRPIYVTFGFGYRQSLNPLSTIEGVAYAEEVPIARTTPMGATQWPTWPEIRENCQDSFDRTTPSAYSLQYFGQQVDAQVGLKFGFW